MKLILTRDILLRPLQLVSGVVERKQTLPILSNILVAVEKDNMTVTATDLEVELIVTVPLDKPSETGKATLPARKLLDICRALPDGAAVELSVEKERGVLRSGKGRFALATLPAAEFPALEQLQPEAEFTVPQAQLRRQLERTQFAMAQQDVRYYLNGMLIELKPERMITVATDGHRMALCDTQARHPCKQDKQVILPRKGVLELQRVLQEQEGEVTVQITGNHARFVVGAVTLTSKLIDGRFPDYQRVLPRMDDKVIEAAREPLRQALVRTSVLSNEKFRSVHMQFKPGELHLHTHNPEQEEAEEDIAIDYQGEPIEVGFNANYLLDALNAISQEKVRIYLTDSNSSAQIEGVETDGCKYVVMPMRL
ncbi:MAG: DNA polymerase III subunit beta [Gammaproteobacteria bacterium]|nr:MAG: DNA polymerase III subunit beta [Gammaproteobacteria bacterium]